MTLGGVTCSVTSFSSTQIFCTTGAHAFGATDIIITNTDGQTVSQAGVYTYEPAPTVSSISPVGGALAGGTAVTIAGTNFLSGAGVKFGAAACSGVTVVNANSITCTTPAHPAGATDVIVTNFDNQTGTLTAGYTFEAAPALSSVSPTAGALAGNTLLTLTGTGFLTGAAVLVGGASCTSVTVVSATQVTCLTPAHLAGVVDVTLTNADNQTSTLSSSYTYQPAPVLSSISPIAGALGGGTTLTLTGTGFVAMAPR